MDQAKAYALSDDDIRSLLGGNIKVTTYPDLEKLSHLNELFDSKGRAVLFIPQQSERQGHWVCLIKNGREIEFFDPYGEPPEAQKDTVPKSKLEQMRMNEPQLARLLDDSGYRILFNKVQLQQLKDDVQTCGRHCVTRLLYYRHPIQSYRRIIERSGMSPDEFVVKVTYDGLGR
jgi:hypothetical protein